eukprot:3355749-Pyramimonas_sp.AAC.1
MDKFAASLTWLCGGPLWLPHTCTPFGDRGIRTTLTWNIPVTVFDNLKTFPFAGSDWREIKEGQLTVTVLTSTRAF